MRILNEPTAAAIAYGLEKPQEPPAAERTILVFHLGGSTYDVTLLSLDDGLFEVLATQSDPHLGGDDFTERTVTYFQRLIKKKRKLDIEEDEQAMARLRSAVSPHDDSAWLSFIRPPRAQL